MSKKQKMLLISLSVISAISILVMVLTLLFSANNVEYGEFVPPEFDESAVLGEPDVPEEAGYSLMNISDDYNIYICGKLHLNNEAVDVYFTSDYGNSALVRLEVLDEDNKIIGETGLIKPGEYVKSVKITKNITSDSKVKMRVIGYDSDTYSSAGSASMSTTITVD